MSLTSPLGLMRHVRKPGLRMEVIPWLNVMLLGLMMYLLSSSYIWAPGLVVSNGQPTVLPKKLNLPTLPVTAGNPSFVGRPDAVLDITKPASQPPQFILNYGSYTLEDLQPALNKLRKSLPGQAPVLMLKGNDDVPYNVILKVCAMAQEAGFASELWAFVPTGPGSAPSASTASPAPAKNTP